MKQKILISLTGAFLSSTLANNAALGSTIFSGNTHQSASVQSSRKLPEKLLDSGTTPIFREVTPALPSNIAPASGSGLPPKPQTILGIKPESNSGALSNGNTATNGNNENVAAAIVNPEPARLPESFVDTTSNLSTNPSNNPSVELAINPYIVPEVIPAPTRTPFQRGEASWYGPGFDGNYSANGEIFNRNAMTAAHPSLPFGTRVLVTNRDNGRSVVVRINDRGPFTGGRVIDLSQGAAALIGMIESGVADVQLDIIQP